MAVKCNFNKRKINSELIEDFMRNMSNTKLNPTHFFIVAATDKKNNSMLVDKSA